MSAGPLSGKSVVVTRSREQAADLGSALEGLGAEVLYFPTIAIVPPESWEPADGAIRSLERYEWVVFTSVNGVERFFGRLAEHDMDARQLAGCRVAAVGPATERALSEHGIAPDFVPAEEFRAEGLVDGFLARGLRPGSRVLLPRALEAREVLPDALRGAGVEVDVVPVYRTVRAEGDPETLEHLRRGDADAVTFTSASTLRHFLALTEDAGVDLGALTVASIGPVTTKAARERGVRVDVEPPVATVPALAEALARALGG